MAEDPFDAILAEVGSISLSQERILRGSPFICPPRFSAPSRSFSSSSDDSDEGGSGSIPDRYRIVHRPFVMRSASGSPSSPSDAGRGRGECDRGEDLGHEGDGEKRSESKRKRSSEEEERRPEKGRHRRVLSKESIRELEDSPVASPSGKPVPKRLAYSGGDGNEEIPQPGRSLVRDDVKGRSVSNGSEKITYVAAGAPLVSYSPPELLKGTHAVPNLACDDADDGGVVRSDANASTGEEVGKHDIGLDEASSRERGQVDGEKGDGSGLLPDFRGSISQEAVPDDSIPLRNAGQAELGVSPLMGEDISSPAEVREQSEGEGIPDRSTRTAASPSRRVALEGENEEKEWPIDLVELFLRFSKEPDKSLEDVDFLDVLTMKGIHIPPPSWWRPGGYSLPDPKSSER